MMLWCRLNQIRLACGVVAALVCLGCQGQQDDPEVLAARAKYLLPDEPPGAFGVLEAREKVTAAEELPEVVLVGRVGDGTDQTWDPGKAAFVIMDVMAEVPDHQHGPGHDPDSCPFCKGETEERVDATALVQVVDAEGGVVGIDARKLLEIERGQLVVVQGRAKIDGLGNLVVAARGVYPRRWGS